MKRFGWHFCWALVAGLPASVSAQALVGDGLKGDYYDGRNFERLIVSRRDARLDFKWQRGQPAAGVPAEEFSVRWTGWLVPPTTGRYVLHLSVDDGMRLWLNGRQLLNEWRGQSLSYYTVAVELKAGEAYPLRLDYCQYAWDSTLLLAWEPPKPAAAESSWRNLWGIADATPAPETIPTRYLFSTNPEPAPVPPPATKVAPAAKASPPRPPRLPVVPLAAARVVAHPRPAAARIAVARPRPDSLRASAALSRLAAGQALTLRALYFEQGKAFLLPAAQASLDSLAAALRQRPSLRLEVQGHTDNQGDSALNRQLSQRRAEAVCQYLAAHGVLAQQLRPVGYGGTQPIADNNQPAQRPRNRRVVLRPF